MTAYSTSLTQVTEYSCQTYDFTLLLDRKSQILSVQVRDGRTWMYILEPYGGGSLQPRQLVVHSTASWGNRDLSKYRFIASFKPEDGQPVHHLFDASPPLEPPGPVEQLAACADET